MLSETCLSFGAPQEMVDAEKAQQVNYRAIDMDDLMDDPELERLHAERLAKLKEEQEKRQEMQRKGHGDYEEVEEGDFLEVVTKTPKVVVQFFHRDFERCKIMDKHMQVLCKKYFDTRFIKISAPVSAIKPRNTFIFTFYAPANLLHPRRTHHAS